MLEKIVLSTYVRIATRPVFALCFSKLFGHVWGMTPAEEKAQKALSPGPWYLQIGDGSMPYYIMTPLDKTIVAATVYKCDADYIIEMSAKITDLEGKVKILESLLESEQSILKIRTDERDKLTKENKKLKLLLSEVLEGIPSINDDIGRDLYDKIKSAL